MPTATRTNPLSFLTDQLDELKAKGSDARRDLSFWGQVGVGAVALGCVSAAALGQIAVGIPCVIGGSASQGLLSFWEKQQ